MTRQEIRGLFLVSGAVALLGVLMLFDRVSVFALTAIGLGSFGIGFAIRKRMV